VAGMDGDGFQAVLLVANKITFYLLELNQALTESELRENNVCIFGHVGCFSSNQ
jgi:hypothetical protein